MTASAKTIVWLGTPESGREFVIQQETDAQRALSAEMLAFRDNDEDEGRFGRYDDFVQVLGDTAVVSIEGSLGYRESWFSLAYGRMTYETLSNIMAHLVADGEIKNVVLDADSPGGVAKGINVGHDAIVKARQNGLRVDTHVSGEAMSAMYWLAGASDRIVADKYAEVGSVGVVAVHMEMSKMLADEGLNVTVFRKGEKKALGSPYEPLTEEAKAVIDASLERKYIQFIDTVATDRKLPVEFVRQTVATGEEFSADKALEIGLIDQIGSYNDLMAQLASAGSDRTNGAYMSKTPMITPKAPEGLDSLMAAEIGIEAEAQSPEGDEVVEPVVTPDTTASASSEPDDETETGTEPEPAAAESGSAQVFAMVEKLNNDVVDLRVQLNTVTGERDALKAGRVGLREIVTESTQNLRVKLGHSAGSDLASLSDEALVSAYQSARSDFVERFPAGARSQVPQDEKPLPKSAVSYIDRAARQATQIGSAKK